nr:MAG TPA: hypothetical protein [Caudoviricetes sp.]
MKRACCEVCTFFVSLHYPIKIGVALVRSLLPSGWWGSPFFCTISTNILQKINLSM